MHPPPRGRTNDMRIVPTDQAIQSVDACYRHMERITLMSPRKDAFCDVTPSKDGCKFIDFEHRRSDVPNKTFDIRSSGRWGARNLPHDNIRDVGLDSASSHQLKEGLGGLLPLR